MKKNYLRILLFLLCFIFQLGLYSAGPITAYHGNLNTFEGEGEDLSLIRHFPKAYYELVEVQEIGFFYVDARADIIKNRLRNGEVWEPEIVALINNYVKEDSTAVDIGSHVGTHTVSMSKKVGPKGKVVAFEPQKKIYAELVMNMEANRCRNSHCYRAAIGSCFKDIQMNPPIIDNEGGTKIGEGGDLAQMIPLDSLELEDVSFIKIDVENMELDVLKGARQTILKNHPAMIIEIMGNTYQPIENRPERVREILQYIEEMGYQVSFIKHSWSDWLALPNQSLL